MRQSIAVIGAGPKAAALASKAACLRREIGADVHVTIFERNSVAANWTGVAGYTDGNQQLCTPVERDLGYPYETGFGSGVAARMQAEYSWMAYLVRKGGYADWVSRGSPRPTHGQYAEYVADAIRLAGARVVTDFEVTGLVARNGRWRVRGGPPGAATDFHQLFDGVVVTGPGPAKRSFAPFEDPALFDGQSFWVDPRAAARFAEPEDAAIVIVGGGGSAAAVAAWLINHGLGSRSIQMIYRQAALYARTPSFFENRVFDDEAHWEKLSDEARLSFVNRLTRSVVWDTVIETLSQAQGLTLVPGRARSISLSPPGGAAPRRTLLVNVESSRPGFPALDEIQADLVIDASGFDQWWFKDILPSDHGRRDAESLRMEARSIDRFLRLPYAGIPPIHAPNLASYVGPGFTSLMALGHLADCILQPYAASAQAA